ncbi:MAG: hypothetical protein HY043_19005 [Verrucomicrobia bacterium]|nr:hypothetical protein [Verrucomicrobiota bacterium]
MKCATIAGVHPELKGKKIKGKKMNETTRIKINRLMTILSLRACGSIHGIFLFFLIFLPSIFLLIPMSIECQSQLLPLTDAEFRRLDYRVTERLFVRHETSSHFRGCSQTFS